MGHIETVLAPGFDPQNNDRMTIDLSSLYEGGEITLAPYGEDNIWLARWTDEDGYYEADNPYDAMVLAMAARLPLWYKGQNLMKIMEKTNVTICPCY